MFGSKRRPNHDPLFQLQQQISYLSLEVGKATAVRESIESLTKRCENIDGLRREVDQMARTLETLSIGLGKLDRALVAFDSRLMSIENVQSRANRERFEYGAADVEDSNPGAVLPAM